MLKLNTNNEKYDEEREEGDRKGWERGVCVCVNINMNIHVNINRQTKVKMT
jgi:hypothetical protein